jgi:hypothetical protein
VDLRVVQPLVAPRGLCNLFCRYEASQVLRVLPHRVGGEELACLGSPGAVANDATAKAGVAALGPSDPRWFLWAFGVARCWPFGSARTLLSLGPPGPFWRPDVGRLLQFSHEHTQIKS